MTRWVDSTAALEVVTPDGTELVRVVKNGVSKAVRTGDIADADAAAAIAAHVALSDPHTQYLTEVAAAAGYQPLDSDLTAIAALTPSNDDIIQRKAGAWTNRTPAQLIADLAALGTTFQPLDSDLTAIAALSTTSYGRSLLALADAAALRSAGGGLVRSIGDIRVEDYLAVGDGVYKTNGVATSGDATFTCASVTWTAADIGKPIVIAGAGAAGATLATTIASVNSGTSIELTNAPSTSVGAAQFFYGTDDTTYIQNALDACTNGQSVLLAPGKTYMVSSLYIDGGNNPMQAWQKKGLKCIGGTATLCATTTGDFLVASKRWRTVDANNAFADNPWHLDGILFEAFGLKDIACVLKMYGFITTYCVFKNGRVANFRFTRQNQDGSTGTTAYLSGSHMVHCYYVTTLPSIVTTYGFHSQGEAANPHLAPTDATMIGCEAFGNIAGASPNMTNGIYLDNNAGWTIKANRTYSCGEGYVAYRYGKNHAHGGNNWDCNSGVAVRVGQIASTSGFASLSGDNLYADVVVDFTDNTSVETFVIDGCDFHFDPDETTTGIGADGKARIVHNNNRAVKTIVSTNNRFKGDNPHRRASGKPLGTYDVRGFVSVDDTNKSYVPIVISQSGATRTNPANTSENILQTVTIPAGMLGPNGSVVVETHWVTNNDASVKTAKVRFNGIAGTAFTDVALTSTTNGHLLTNIWNQNATNSQRGGTPAANSAPFGVYGSGSATASVDTTAAVDIVITGQLADSTDTLQLVFHRVTVVNAA